MKTRILSYLLVFSMILALLPASALAEGESTTTQHVTATVKHAFDNSGAETGQITAQIEAYLTDTDDQSRTVKPCDIIFLIEQSTFMNTQTDTTQYGQERADILNSMESLLKNLPTPTTDGEHRVAIAGFGRINNSGSSDSYIESQHPGTQLSATQNPSLNTGYYTCENNAPDFHSQSGWTEWDKITDHNDTTLPEMPEGYLANESYDKVFMSIDDAKNVIDVDKMVSWHAGASRMDAGLQITEQLAKIAQAHKATDEDRNLIIFVAASSLPYQNGVGVQFLRSEAAQAAATELKNKYNATIFGFGDFRALNLQNGMSSEDQRTQFNETMAGICGNSTTQDGTPYFKGLSQVHDIGEALNELLIQIDANVNPNAERRHINVENFQEKSTEHTSHTSHTWKELKEKHHILTSSAINETASVDYYRFTGYENGNPQFGTTPIRHIELRLSDIGSSDSIQTALSLLPIPPADTKGTAYGEKAVITITDPVCVDYKWAGRWRPKFDPPDHEHAARGVKHSPANPEQNETTSDTMKLKFDGWYRLWDDNIDREEDGKKTWTTYDGKKYVAYQDNVYDAFGSDLTLYGRWIPSIDVNFQWIGSVIPADATPPSTVSLALSDDGTASFTPIVPSQEGYEFDGWYKNSACTDRYNESGENLTKNTFLYGRWTKIGTKKVTFTVVNGSWNTESDWYKNNIGNTDADTATDTITVNVPLRNGKGTLTPDLVPHVDNQDMTPADDYKAPGTWGDKAPDTNTDAITENGDYEYTYTFPEADTYTITYRWVTGTEVPEGVSLPAQQTEKESNAGKNPTFEIATVTFADKKWSFSGWYTNEALTGTAISDSYTFPEGNVNDTKNLTLYGKWTHDPCTVTFYADYFQPAQGHFNTDDYTISYTVPYGPTLAKVSKAVPTPVTDPAHPYYFEGWGDFEPPDTQGEQEGTEGTEDTEDAEDTKDTEEPVTHSDDSLSTAGTFYTSKAIQDMTIKSDLNFVAQWWPIVTFNANGGDWELTEGRPTERYVPVPANKNHIDSLRPPAREGYTFLGWYDTSGKPIDFKTQTFDRAETVYAHWAKNATVTFKIVNGYWSGNTTEDKTVTVVLHPQANGSASGTLGASHVPTIMIPAAGYENTPGHWDVTPNTEENGISGDVTYTYIFGKKHHSSSSKDENKDKDNNKENNKDNNKDNNTGETTPTKVPDLLNGSNHFAYVVGYKDGNVRPQGNITRAETAAIFFRLLKEEVRSENLSKHNDFADVTEDSWYNTAVSTMAGMNILKGRTANSFVPQAPITRAEFAAICARFDSGKAEENNSFTDISGHWAEKEIERAATLGWVSGYTDGSFHPDAPITRAEAMTLINRVLCRMPETKADLLDSMTKWPDNQPGAWYYLAVQEATNSHTYEQKDSKYETWTALTAEPDWSKY